MSLVLQVLQQAKKEVQPTYGRYPVHVDSIVGDITSTIWHHAADTRPYGSAYDVYIGAMGLLENVLPKGISFLEWISSATQETVGDIFDAAIARWHEVNSLGNNSTASTESTGNWKFGTVVAANHDSLAPSDRAERAEFEKWYGTAFSPVPKNHPPFALRENMLTGACYADRDVNRMYLAWVAGRAALRKERL